MQYYSSFIGVDFETSGLINEKKLAVHNIAVTEIALVAMNEDLEIVDEYSSLIKPYKEDLIWEKEAEIASGISKQMCEEQGRDINIVCQEVIEFFNKHKAKGKLPVIFGHNFLKFDSYFLVNLFEYCKQDLFKYIQQEPEDTIKWSRMMWKEASGYKLGQCCEMAGITLENAHRALSDTIVTTKLMQFFLKNLRGINNQNQTVVETHQFRKGFEL